ncbi:hypothetical protein CBA19CS22_34420 [Caballeronia novacaledonica]|uniref:Uncharacterized protein n=1 Tax=Caballeronia novacaledonica TaxID=1544861 RepID=A0ACB5R3A3_9BURK|nr:hypothetical protein CBA19CS22_34420 [Caballeronia novacaledonica]
MALERLDQSALQLAVHQAGANWTPGVPSVSELLEVEKQLRLGATAPGGEEELRQREQAAAANRGATMLTAQAAPATFDLRNVDGRNFITSINDQGSCRPDCR